VLRVVDDSAEEIFADMSEAQEAADKRVKPSQRALKPGDCYLTVCEDFVVYGEVLEPTHGCDADEIKYQQEMWAQPHMANYRFARSFSIWSSEGELGDVHVSSVSHVITRTQFEAFKILKWTCDLEQVRSILFFVN
jgi:hypothetical protein